MYKEKFNRKFPRNRKYMPGEYDIRERQDAGIPTKDTVSNDSGMLNQLAFKDLAYAKPISVQANPTAEATKAAVPYAIINSTNQVWEANYPGDDNTAGNTIPLLNNSTTSTLLNEFDCGQVNLELKYLYAAIQPTDINQALNVQLGKSMVEALSKAYSETYINMPFFKDLTVGCDMDNCDPEKRTQAFIWYQTMLQNIACIPGKYNLLVSLEQHLKDSCYNRDVAPLDDLFGLLRKNSFRAKINAFSNIITGEYFDLAWFKQVNTLTMVPSRKSNSIRHPLLVIDAIHDIPANFTLSRTVTGDVIDYANYDNIQVGSNTFTFKQAMQYIIDLLSPYNVLAWARKFTNGLTVVTPTGYYNEIISTLDAIRTTLARFPGDVSEIRAVLDVANRVGLNRWQRGVFFDVTKEMNYQPVFNKLCNDVFVNYLASPNTIYYDNVTLRWKYYTLWNEFLGIPKFDKVNGGSFLSFSTRQFENTVTPSTDTKFLIPKLFDIPANGKVSFVNRLGIQADLTYSVYNSTTIAQSPIYYRLNSLGYSDYDQRIPTVDVSSGYANIPAVASAMFRLMTNLFSLGNVVIDPVNNVINETLDSDIVSVLDIELDDVSNAMIAFAQAYAPFKVYTPVKERTIGFREGIGA